MALEIWGEANIYIHKSVNGSDTLIKKFIRGETNPREERDLKKIELCHHKHRNLLTNRFFDRMAAAFSQSNSLFYIRPDYGGVPGSNPGNDYEIYQNTVASAGSIGFGPALVGGHHVGNVPELIGIGSGNTAAHKEDRGLYLPFPHVLGGGPYNYRNTFNSKEGGTFPGQDNSIIRCGTTWEAAYIPPAAIEEIGLFYNVWVHAQRLWAAGVPPNIVISGFGNLNRAWEILNISSLGGAAAHFFLTVFQRNEVPGAIQDGFSWNEGTQTISYTGLGNPATHLALFTFSPRHDHQADPVVGSSYNFEIPPSHTDFTKAPQLFARVVLPTPLTKNANETLTIVWIIYLKRVV